jgi:hypothetical protein
MWYIGFRGTLEWGSWWYTSTGLHLNRGSLRRRGLKEGAAKGLGD